MLDKYAFVTKYMENHKLKAYNGGEYPVKDMTFTDRITVFVDCPELVLADDYIYFTWVFYLEKLLNTYFNISSDYVVFIQRIIL